MVERDRPRRIAVCGASRADTGMVREAEAVGAAIAKAGAILICGGMGGVMEAAARGAARQGGQSIGVLPGPDAAAANQWIDVPLATGMGEARNALVVRFAEAVIAIGGSWGTLSEIALARRLDIPVILLSPTLATGLGLEIAPDPESAVNRALALLT